MFEYLHALLPLLVFCGIADILARTRYGQYLSAPAIIIALGVAGGQLGIVPREHASYGMIMMYIVPAAIALLLAHADLRSIWRDAGVAIAYFALAAFTVVIGGFAASLLFDTGSEWRSFVPVLVSTYIGGSLNLVSTANFMGVDGSPLMASVLAADAMIGTTYLLLLSLVSGRVKHETRTHETQSKEVADIQEPPEAMASEPEVTDMTRAGPPPRWSRPLQITLALVFAVGVCAAAYFLTDMTGQDRFFYLFLILIAVGIANVIPRQMKALSDAPKIGVAGMYLFFAVIGVSTPISAFDGPLQTAMMIAGVIVAVHILLFFPMGRLLKGRFDMLLTLSNASILGPATAAAIASARGWSNLVAVGTICGVLGYVIGNFLALALFQIM